MCMLPIQTTFQPIIVFKIHFLTTLGKVGRQLWTIIVDALGGYSKKQRHLYGLYTNGIQPYKLELNACRPN